MSEFSALMSLVFAWLPEPLYKPVMASFAVAFLIIMVKILIALAEIVSKVVVFFLGGS